jgi:hypothetical protein
MYFILAPLPKLKSLNTALRLVAQRSWQDFPAYASWVQASACTPVIPAVSYLPTGLAGCSMGSGINRSARKLTRTSRVIKKQKFEQPSKFCIILSGWSHICAKYAIKFAWSNLLIFPFLSRPTFVSKSCMNYTHHTSIEQYTSSNWPSQRKIGIRINWHQQLYQNYLIREVDLEARFNKSCS